MEQIKHGTAATDTLQRYTIPNLKVVFIKTQGILCLSEPSVNGYENGSHSEGDME